MSGTLASVFAIVVFSVMADIQQRNMTGDKSNSDPAPKMLSRTRRLGADALRRCDTGMLWLLRSALAR
ncbi:hypothetical protein XvhCFBP2543_05295 [Xanthomonas vasicola]|nr:hypothetical protein NX04_16575 [Xanthomonas vasicola]KGR42673.1 hypothetical protein NX05_13185 [Xanthomonas vasicola]KGR55869.1 hypothetical protein NX79_22065 [Xanthomonas vasicola]PPV03530.1 hypothetical protein XvhCFBP2543_05295 [Xanthomonas vasicola]